MFFISRHRFTEEVEKRVCEEMKRVDEYRWREDREREQHQRMRDLEFRLIAVEKKNGIDHPSHSALEAVRAGY